jgi:pSer/pThr/pTyr-binding forkhead associated (FHA) protein
MIAATTLLIFRIALAVALYSFVGWAFYSIWQDLKHQKRNYSLQKVPPLIFRILGKDETQTRYFYMPEVIIGRDPGCDFLVQDEAVSARHSRLSYHNHQWWVEDMHSTNGTYLNNERLSTPTVMINGDELHFGHVTISITIGEEE